jgi:hypothetical protein
MLKNESPHRMIQTEVSLRKSNEDVQVAIEESFSKAERNMMSAEFYCECSDKNCKKLINLSVAEFKALHERRDYFVVCKGHVEPKIERVIKRLPKYWIVKKYALKP